MKLSEFTIKYSKLAERTFNYCVSTEVQDVSESDAYTYVTKFCNGNFGQNLFTVDTVDYERIIFYKCRFANSEKIQKAAENALELICNNYMKRRNHIAKIR